MRKPPLNGRIAWAAMILTAYTLGYDSDQTLTAHKVLFDGYILPPCFIGEFNTTAIRLHNAIAADKRTEEANRIAEGILTEAGY